MYRGGMEQWFSRLSVRQCALFVAILAFGLYIHPVWVNDFVTFDDSVLITKNPAVQRMTLMAAWHFFTSYDPELYVPLTMLSLQITHGIFGLSAWAFHAGNLALHILSAVVVFLIGERLTARKGAALFIAAVFAVHPLNTEAVLWAAARKDTLAAAFCLVAVWAYLQFREAGVRRMFVLSIVMFVLGLLSKVSIVTLPLVFMLLDVLSGDRARDSVRRLWPFFVFSVLFGLIALYGKRGVLESSSTVETIILTIRSLGFYLWKIFAAWDFAVIYPVVRPIVFDVMTAVSAATLAGLAAVAWLLRKRVPLCTFGIVWFFLFVLPNSTNYLKNGFLFAASDRYSYLAMIGIVLAVVEIFPWAAKSIQSNAFKVFQSILAMVILVALSVSSVVQSRTWKNSEVLYRNVLRRSPDSTLALSNLAVVVRLEPGREEEGEDLLREALRIDPLMVQALVNMGQIEKKRGNLKEAEQYFAKAVAVLDKKSQRFFGLDDLGAYYFLAEILDATGRRTEALAIFERAVARAPNLAEPHHNFAVHLQKASRIDEAIAHFTEAVRLEPTYIHSHYLLAGILAERGRLEEAETLLRQVVAVDPNYQKAKQHLANIIRLRSN